ncbi:MAG TPA: hypothetical protein VFT51_06070 [Bacillales bacterium]|nr:hypothetical protein [Bacillales bacterium]
MFHRNTCYKNETGNQAVSEADIRKDAVNQGWYREVEPFTP